MAAIAASRVGYVLAGLDACSQRAALRNELGRLAKEAAEAELDNEHDDWDDDEDDCDGHEQVHSTHKPMHRGDGNDKDVDENDGENGG